MFIIFDKLGLTFDYLDYNNFCIQKTRYDRNPEQCSIDGLNSNMFENVYFLCVYTISLVGGLLLKKQVQEKNNNSETVNKIQKYIVVNLIYVFMFVAKIVIVFVQEICGINIIFISYIYIALSYVNYYIVPITYLFIFYFNWNKEITKEIENTEVVPFDTE